MHNFSIKLLSVVFFFIFFPNLVLFAQRETPIKITCSFKKQEDTTVIFSVQTGYLEVKTLEASEKLDKNHRSYFFQDVTQPTMVKVQHDYRTFEVYCEPGDSIHLDCDGEVYPYEIRFSGTPTAVANNQLLHQLRTEFTPLSNKYLLSQIFTKSNMEFRKIMDDARQKKWSFYHDYVKKNQPKFSPDFFNFLQAEINYWYAYNLMRYRDEHLSLVSAENIYMPDAYFDFLNETIINDDKGFAHPNYVNFLKLYADFRIKNPGFPHGLAAKQVFVMPKLDTISLYTTVNCNGLISQVKKGNRLLVLDKMTYQETPQKAPLAIRVKVKSQDGLVGWVRVTDLTFEPTPTKINSNPLYISDIEKEEFKDVTSCVTNVDSLGYYLDPNDKHSFLNLRKDDKLAVLNEQTTENISYVLNNKRYSSPLAKTRNKYGVIGWTPVAGLQLHLHKSSSSELITKVSSASQSKFNYFDYFLHGKPLYFAYGRYLKEQLEFNGKNSIKPAMEVFDNIAYPDLALEMQHIYENEDKKYTFDSSSVVITENSIDQRRTSLNINTLAFILTSDATRNNPKSSSSIEVLNPDQGTLADNGTKTNAIVTVAAAKSASKKKAKTFALTEPNFVEVKYEFKPITIKGSKKLWAKYNINVLTQPNIVSLYDKKESYKTKKGKGFWHPDTFIYKINAVEPLWGRIVSKSDSTRCYLEPGQSYFLTEENNQLKINTKINTPLTLIKDLAVFYDKQTKNIKPYYNQAPFAFKQTLYKLYELRKDSLKRIKIETKTMKNYVELQNMNADYWLFNHLLLYAADKSKAMLDSIGYFDFMPDVRIQNDRALLSPEYQKFVEVFLDYQVTKNAALQLSVEEIARLTYSTKVLKYWQAKNSIETLKASFDAPSLDKIQHFNDNNSYPVLTEAVKSAFNEEKMKKEGYRMPDFSLQNDKGVIYKNTDFKNKVVLLHFWSYSDPNYAKKFKQLQEIEAQLKSSFYFNIVYVNTDNDYWKWKKAVKKFKSDKFQVYPVESNTYIQSFSDYFNAARNGETSMLMSKKGLVGAKIELNKQSVEEIKTVIRQELSRK